MFNRIFIAIVIAIILSGCSTHVISSNPKNVTVKVYWKDVETAQRLADAECAEARSSR